MIDLFINITYNYKCYEIKTKDTHFRKMSYLSQDQMKLPEASLLSCSKPDAPVWIVYSSADNRDLPRKSAVCSLSERLPSTRYLP